MLKIYKTMRAGIWLYRLEGELVRGTHDKLVRTCMELYKLEKSKGRPYLILDLWDVDFVDSQGLGGMLALKHTIEQRGGMLKLTRINPKVKRVMDALFKEKVFQVSHAS